MQLTNTGGEGKNISTPTHQQTPLFIKSCSRIAQILLLLAGPFCSGHFNPFQSFFLLWIWTVTITRPDVKDIKGL
jgi:hypothetical protein